MPESDDPEAALSGRRIVVTRAPHQAPELASLLRRHGAVPLLYPCLEVAEPEEVAPLDEALRAAVEGHFDRLVLTSQNTVRMLARRLVALGVHQPVEIPTAAVGPRTAELAQQELGLEVDFVPEAHSAAALCEALRLREGERILLPQGNLAGPGLAEALKARGARVRSVCAYRTARGHGGVPLPQLLADGAVDAITLASPSSARFLLERLGVEGGGGNALGGLCLAAIGLSTEAAARACGLPVQVTATPHTLAGLVSALAAHFAQGAGGGHLPPPGTV